MKGGSRNGDMVWTVSFEYQESANKAPPEFKQLKQRGGSGDVRLSLDKKQAGGIADAHR